MPFPSGGASRRKTDRIFREQLLVAVNEPMADGKGKRKLRALADKMVDRGLEGDVGALTQIRDTLDGKPATQIQIEADLRQTVTFIMDIGDDSTEIMENVTHAVTQDDPPEPKSHDIKRIDHKDT